MTNGIRLPAVVIPGEVSEEEALRIVQGIFNLTQDLSPTAALGFMLTSVLTFAATRLPREGLDGIYRYETSRVYGVEAPAVQRRLPARPHVRRKP